MDVEHGLICSVVELGEVQEVLDCHMKSEYFNNDMHRKVWDMVVEHWTQHSTVADEDTIHRAYPNYKFLSPPDPLRYYIEQVIDNHQFRMVADLVNRVMDEFDDGGPNPGDRLSKLLQSSIQSIAREHPTGRSVDWFQEGMEEVIRAMEDRMAHPGYLRGIGTGFDTIDKVTGGFQPEHLITLAAVPKAGKSSFVLKSAMEAALQGYRVLFFTFEMSMEEQMLRLASLHSGVGLTHLINGTITHPEMQQMEQALKIHRDREGFTIVADPGSTTTVTAVDAYIKRLQPQLVVIDGVYLMDDEQGEPKMSPRALSNIIQSLKKVAQASRIPILCTTQALASRAASGIGTGSIGYSSSFAQSSDVVLGVDRLSENIRKFKVMDIRSGPRIDTYVKLDWTQGLIEEIDEVQADLLVSQQAGISGSLGHP